MIGTDCVYCTVQFEAVHCWPECPYDEVKYLRDPHRHIFWIRCYKQVKHDDRDTEFIMLKHQVEEYLLSTFPTRDLGSMSCEMIGEKLIDQFDLVACDVSEDNENGSVVYSRPINSWIDNTRIVKEKR